MPTDSFFNFFSPPLVPKDDEDEDAPEDIEERLELDYQLGEDIKEKLIPRAIDWFTGEALQFEELDEDLEEGDFEDEDDDEDDDVSEDRDDDEESEDEVAIRTYHSFVTLLIVPRMMVRSQSKKLLSASRAKLPVPVLQILVRCGEIMVYLHKALSERRSRKLVKMCSGFRYSITCIVLLYMNLAPAR